MAEQQSTPTIHDLEKPINRRYRLSTCLSRGELGELYHAHDLVQDRPCSLKLVPHILHSALRPQQRLANEAVLLSRLAHRNIIEGYELNWDEEGNLFLAMAPLDGVDLERLLAEARVLPLTLVLEILGSVGAALQYIHDHGIVHGDIEPHSIFLNHEYSQSPNDAYHAIKLLNFGMATLTASEMSNDETDASRDQTALAALAYRMLTGSPLPKGSEPESDQAQIAAGLEQVRPALPAHVLAALKRALSTDKAARFARVQDFVHALDSELVCQRPTRELKREELIQNLVEEMAADEAEALVKPVAAAAPDEAVPSPIELEHTTRKYSTLSMPSLLLGPAAPEQGSELAWLSAEPLLPAPRVTALSSLVPWLFAGVALLLVCGAAVLSPRRTRSASLNPPSQALLESPLPTPPQIIIESLRRPSESAPGQLEASDRADRDEKDAKDDKSDAVSRRSRRVKEAERTVPVKDASAVAAALSSAQAEYVNGNYRAAVLAARSVQDQSPVHAWRIIGAAACYLRDTALIRDAYRRLRSRSAEQGLLTYACKLNGLDPTGNPIKPSI